MALTRSFKDTVKARAERDAAFCDALLTEAVDQFLAADLDTGEAVLHDYINATIGFERLAAETGSSSKSLMRMLSPTGNPTASNLFSVLSTVQKAAGVHLAGGKLLTPGARRTAVSWAIEETGYSQRRACKLIGREPKT